MAVIAVFFNNTLRTSRMNNDYLIHHRVWLRYGMLLCGIIFLGAVIYWFVPSNDSDSNSAASETDTKKEILYWYDPMVPDQHFDKPGKSPFMDMELVPKYVNEESGASVTIDASIRQNLGMRTETVVFQQLASEMRAAGYIAMDEHRIYSVPVRSGGYVEKLWVKAVGDRVVAGQKVAEVFSPELIIAQREYLTLLESPSSTKTESLRTSAIRKLERLGMVKQEIADIAEKKLPLERVGIYAPRDNFSSGHVMNLDLREGAKIENGQSLMLIADLNRVWQIIEIPEREARHIHIGQKAKIHLTSSPDAAIQGEVDYIYPEIDVATRSLRVRVSLPNPKHQLRPGQYAETVISSSPRKVLMVPSAAVIRTGVRNVVIVQESNHFRPVQVTTGNEQDGRTEIISGLNAGETVIVSGQFLIDSEASLSGVLARMSSDTSTQP